jgi:hypothetical protein
MRTLGTKDSLMREVTIVLFPTPAAMSEASRQLHCPHRPRRRVRTIANEKDTHVSAHNERGGYIGGKQLRVEAVAY